MRTRDLALRLAAVPTLALAVATGAEAQNLSAHGFVALSATFGAPGDAESLRLTINPGSMSFDLNTASPVLGNVVQTVSLEWSLSAQRTNIELLLAIPTDAALFHSNSNGQSFIPAGNLLSNLAGAGFAACAPDPRFEGFSACGQVQIPTSSAQPVQRTFNLQIDKTGLSLSQGTYTGTLTVVAFAL